MALRIRQKASRGVWTKTILFSIVFIFVAQCVGVQVDRHVAALSPDAVVTDDVTPPEVEFLTPNDNPQRNLHINVKVMDNNLSRVSFDVTRLNDNATFSTKEIIVPEGEAVLSLSEYDLCAASIASDTTTGCDATWIQDGSYRIRANADSNKGPSNTSTTSKVLIDTVDPRLAASLKAQRTNDYVTDNTFAIEGKARDNGSGLSKVVIVLIRSDGATIESGNLTLQPEGGFKYSMSGVSDGDYDAYVSAYDRAGNKKDHSAISFTVDTQDPVVKIASPIENQMAGKEVHLKGVIEDANLVSYSYLLKNANGDTKRSSDEIREAVIDRKITLGNLASGKYTLTITAIDAAGHSSREAISLTIDHTIPRLTISGPQKMKLDGTATFTIKSTEALNGPPSVFINGILFDGALEQIDATLWRLQYTPSSVARYSVTVTANDAYNNPSSSHYSGARLVLNVIANPPTTNQTSDANLRLQNAATALAQPLIVNTPTETDEKKADTNTEESAVLGSETQGSGSDVPVIAPSDKGWQIMGVAWYWVLSILAIIFTAAWRAVALHRRKQLI